MKLKIGGIEWRVVESDLLAQDASMGKCYKETLEIHIASNLKGEQRKATLLHEALHACCHVAGIQDDEELDEEEIVSRLEFPVYTFIRDNDIML